MLIGHGQDPLFRSLMPRRAADILTLPDGAPSKVASRASDGWLAAFSDVHNGKIGDAGCRSARGINVSVAVQKAASLPPRLRHADF
jgi:hypothetical protein